MTLLHNISIFAMRLLLISVLLNSSLVCGHEICRNNGTLKMEGRKRICLCIHPFTGQHCEEYACVNGLATGLQYNPESSFFNKRCLCDPGWTGTLCNVSLHDRCGENGIEVNAECQCNDNFVGDRCQYVTKCINGQLYNGRCACHYGWAGDHCDQIICHQGQADESNTACTCPSKYRGKYCDFCAESSNSPPPECAKIGGDPGSSDEGFIRELVVGVVAVIALLALGILYCIFCHKAPLLKNQSTERTARQKVIDTEIRSTNSGYEIRPMKCILSQTKDKELSEHSKSLFRQPPPSYHIPAAVQVAPTVPEREGSKTKAETASTASKVPFF